MAVLWGMGHGETSRWQRFARHGETSRWLACGKCNSEKMGSRERQEEMDMGRAREGSQMPCLRREGAKLRKTDSSGEGGHMRKKRTTDNMGE